MWDFPGQKAVRVHPELGSQLLNPLLRSCDALREEQTVPLKRLLQDQTGFVRLRSGDFNLLHYNLLEAGSVLTPMPSSHIAQDNSVYAPYDSHVRSSSSMFESNLPPGKFSAIVP